MIHHAFGVLSVMKSMKAILFLVDAKSDATLVAFHKRERRALWKFAALSRVHPLRPVTELVKPDVLWRNVRGRPFLLFCFKFAL